MVLATSQYIVGQHPSYTVIRFWLSLWQMPGGVRPSTSWMTNPLTWLDLNFRHNGMFVNANLTIE